MIIKLNLSNDMVLSYSEAPLSIMQYSKDSYWIKIATAKLDKTAVALIFELPKGQKKYSTPLEYNDTDGCYEYLLDGSITYCDGEIRVQVSCIKENQCKMSNILGENLVIEPSIMALEEIEKESPTVIQQLYDNLADARQNINSLETTLEGAIQTSSAIETRVDDLYASSEEVIIYDKSSSDSALNWGYPQGMPHRTTINNLDLSSYKIVRFYCEHDRTIILDLHMTFVNKNTQGNIESMLFLEEAAGSFAFGALECYYKNTELKINNIVRTTFGGSVLSVNNNYKVVKIGGIRL